MVAVGYYKHIAKQQHVCTDMFRLAYGLVIATSKALEVADKTYCLLWEKSSLNLLCSSLILLLYELQDLHWEHMHIYVYKILLCWIT